MSVRAWLTRRHQDWVVGGAAQSDLEAVFFESHVGGSPHEALVTVTESSGHLSVLRADYDGELEVVFDL